MRETSVEICIIGAGAAGLWAARVAASHGRDVLVLEKTKRTGTKVLASGGTKCNLTTTLDGPAAAELFGRRGARFLRTAFRVLPPLAVREAFAGWGVETVEAPLEKIFPKTGKAVHVRDALERSARTAGARIELDSGVSGIEPHAGRFRVTTYGGDVVVADRVLVSAGGKSYPATGTVGEAYAWLGALGCEIVEPVPALVPLTSGDPAIKELTGIAIQDVVATLRDADGKRLVSRHRPVLFTHHGVSGPGAMDPSGLVARAPSTGFRLELDLVPSLERETLRDLLVAAARDEGAKRLGHVLPVELPRRVFDLVTIRAGLPAPTMRVSELTKPGRHALIETLKGMAVPIDGTLGFEKAEVTAGGLAIDEVDPGTMAIRRLPGLFACGEVLDVDGPIGGLNFQAAFATAELAGRALAKS